MSTFLKQIKKGSDIIESVSNRILELGNSFYDTGNHILSHELDFLSSQLVLAKQTVHMAISDNIREQLDNSQQNGINLVKTAIAATKQANKGS